MTYQIRKYISKIYALKSIIIVIVICLFKNYDAHAQQELNEQQRKEIIEKIIETREGGADYTDLLDQLDYFLRNPIDLNHCSKEDLQKISILQDYQIDQLFAHRQRFGDFISLYELQVVPGFDEAIIKTLLPFVRVVGDWRKEQVTLRDMFKKGSHHVVWLNQRQLEENEGQRRRRTSDTAGNKSFYQGNALRSVLRYQYSFGSRLSLAFTAEKDEGEAFLRGANTRGLDFNSAHIALSDYYKIKKLVIGDYNLSLGQGLTFGSGLSFGKSAMVLNVKRTLNGIRPYRSLNENEFLRGVATTIEFKHFGITAFGSKRILDANINTDTVVTGEDQNFSSIISSGLHRTASEIANKHILGQWITGGELYYHAGRLRLGLSGVYTHFEVARNPSNQPYNYYLFSGKNDIKFGLNYSWSYHNFNFFGETALNKNNGGLAAINGLIISLSPKVDMIFAYRNYTRNYQPLITNAFGETSGNNNEAGLYTAMTAKMGRGLVWNAYLDNYTFSWLKYQVNVPHSHGYDYLTELNYIPSKTVSMYIRFRGEHKQYGTSASAGIFDNLTFRNRYSGRFQIGVKVSPTLSLSSRLESTKYFQDQYAPERGTLIYQDMDMKLFKNKFNLSARLVMFNIDGFYSRIYTYENDMLYTFAVPSFQNKGYRIFALGSFKIIKKIKCAIKVGMTTYSNIENVGSGLELTKGPRRTDVKVQLMWNL
jgi:hypothetical protein